MTIFDKRHKDGTAAIVPLDYKKISDVKVNTSGSFQYSLNNEGLLTQSSPIIPSPLLSSAILTY